MIVIGSNANKTVKLSVLLSSTVGQFQEASFIIAHYEIFSISVLNSL